MPAVVGDIIERPTVVPPTMPAVPTSDTTGGFPRVAHRSVPKARVTASALMSGSPYPAARNERPSVTLVGRLKKEEEAGAVEGGLLAEEIHEENMRKLANMSSHEIAAAQAELASALDPSLLDMLRLRARRQPPLPAHRCPSLPLPTRLSSLPGMYQDNHA